MHRKAYERFWPEILISVLLLFFALRELGSFPAAWEDEGLFMLPARALAEGRGYVLEILDTAWRFPYVLGVGPTVILPVALISKVFGFSIAVARIPSILYLIGSVAIMYLWTHKTLGLFAARWATLLLVTLSAFVNTGKPMLGEVPAFFFLLLGFFAFSTKKHPYLRSVLAGICFELAAMTKLTFAVLFPALLIALCVAMFERRWKSTRDLCIAGLIAAIIFLIWNVIELKQAEGFLSFFMQFAGGGERGPLFVLFSKPLLLIRMVYLAFGLFFLLAIIGFTSNRASLHRDMWIMWGITTLLFIIHFLNNEGWYRHLLPAHLLLLPFVPSGALLLLRRKFALILLASIVTLQGLWQLDHRGSSRSNEAEGTAAMLMERFSSIPLIIRHSEVFVRLPSVPNWKFLPQPEVISYSPKSFVAMTKEQSCTPQLQKLSPDQQKLFGERITKVSGRFFIVRPNEDCAW